MVMESNGIVSHLPPGQQLHTLRVKPAAKVGQKLRVVDAPWLRLPQIIGAVLGLAPHAYRPVVPFAHFFHIHAACFKHQHM